MLERGENSPRMDWDSGEMRVVGDSGEKSDGRETFEGVGKENWECNMGEYEEICLCISPAISE